MNKKRKSYIDSCEVSYVKSERLGGYLQKYAVEGKRKDLPVVISLHGGPGSPIPFSVGCRGLFPDFTDKFIMVYWDQLGCGANNFPVDDRFSIEQFANMSVDLIKAIKKDFPNNKLFLFGMSWGSVLALISAARMPKEIDGVLVCGQVLTAPMFSDYALETIKNSSAPQKEKDFVEKLHAQKDVTFQEGMRLSKIIRKYTDGYSKRDAESMPIGWLIKGMFSSPDYRLKDFLAVFKNGYAKNQSLVKEMSRIDLRDMLKDIACPYMIFQGETDIVTSTKELVIFADGCQNENVRYQVIHDMGHFPSASAMKLIRDYLCGMLA